MINTQKAKAVMVEAGYTQVTLAKDMKMSVNTLNLKINGKSPFDINEAETFCNLCKVDDLSERANIFLP